MSSGHNPRSLEWVDNGTRHIVSVDEVQDNPVISLMDITEWSFRSGEAWIYLEERGYHAVQIFSSGKF